MQKVFGNPTPQSASRESSAGIPQVVLNLEKYLTEFGYELVNTPEEADLFAQHAGSGEGVNCQVAHNHGLYPTYKPELTDKWQWEVNRRVIADLTAAREITVPSQWVADIIRRDLHIEPHVIPWAIEPEQWRHNEQHQNYVLWNKNRTEGVCTPEFLNALANDFKQVNFVSTFGQQRDNTQITGRIPHDQMREYIIHAGVYLATTKETGDIGSREAMAAGVPVLGFNQGALADLVVHGETGFLAEVGDYAGLQEGLIYCLQNRDILGRNAQAAVQDYTWLNVAEQFAKVYDLALSPHLGPLASVIVPCHNYGHYILETLNSIYEQATLFDIELIIVNDGSIDNSQDVIETWANDHKDKFNVYLINQQNRGVAHARNAGIEQAQGKYIACLDADDRMGQGYLQVTVEALEQDHHLGITYAGIQIIDKGASQWPEQFDYKKQTTRRNQVPSLCTFTKDYWRRAGGYRQDKHPAEDADLWLRITSLGGMARKVTEAPLFEYRMHDKSASAHVRLNPHLEPDWIGGKGWIASKQFPFAAPVLSNEKSNIVRNYDQPNVSIIIPVGNGHERLVKNALDSVEGQSHVFWECIVVNDSQSELELDSYPWVKLHNANQQGAGAARNIGLKHAKGKTVLFLDADDFLLADFIQDAWDLYKKSGYYVYTDWYSLDKEGNVSEHETPEFETNRIFNEGAFHAVTALVPRWQALEVNGFNENLQSWEDVDFYMRLITSGYCGIRLARPLMVYRFLTGSRREDGLVRQQELKQFFNQHYSSYISGEKEIMCGCAKMKPALLAEGQEMQEIIYHGPSANHEVVGGMTKAKYGRRRNGDRFYIYIKDLAESKKYEAITEIEEMPIRTAIPPVPALV